MQYFSHEDAVNPGKYATWTCSITFDKTSNYATKDSITVKNYYGEQSWSEDELTSFQMWGLDSADETTEKWQTEYARTTTPNTNQTCTAARTVGDSALEMVQNDYQWGDFPGFVDIKENTSTQFYSGFKIWSDAGRTQILEDKAGIPFTVFWCEKFTDQAQCES